ncbi:TonB-dependent receptor plug domain-containing protein [Sphingomonas sp. Ag1]|uniref:TonB-dependent receptor plug domain-containing protein n=1 Tax=Sphingomonas sp. Ag1 TaxID=1642949 RepID=UPI000622433D|nr:TonB-dependent receptor plug domain-containing protein [Sphingomonas sp. Ag1]KKI20355.1 hypothetical protein XM50_05695 [Sphingomonas sp. Ag1]
MITETILLTGAATTMALGTLAALPAHAQADTARTDGAHRADDILVTASPLRQRADETVTPVVTLTGDELVHRRTATLGETLAGQPGVNFDNFGGGASRPVIRGQTAPRVQILSDASEIADASRVSPDHAVVTEPLLLRGIEVLRGPATLLYCGGAIGGAVNLLDSKIPTAIPVNGIEGVAEGRLGTADDERSLVGGITAGAGNFALRVEGVHRESDDYRVPSAFGEDRVHGSYNDTSTVSVGGAFQERLFARLRPLTGGRLYVVGLDPYVPADEPTEAPARIVWRIGRLRDSCLLLAGERPYREYPAEWVIDNLRRSGFEPIAAERFPIRFGARFVEAQIAMCAPRITRLADRTLAAALEAHAAVLRTEALALIEAEGALASGADYVIAAEPR